MLKLLVTFAPGNASFTSSTQLANPEPSWVVKGIDERVVGHAIILVGNDFKLLCTGQFRDVVGHNLRVAHLNDTFDIYFKYTFEFGCKVTTIS